MGADQVFVDTNILVYAHDIDAGEKHRIARDRSSLYGLDPAGPLTMAAATAALLAIASVAALLPAQRASRIDPLASLRHD